MKSFRNLVLAGTLGIAAALASGAASAAPASVLEIGVPVTTESAVTPAYHFGGHRHGYRLCHVPFWKLAQWYGYWQARMIKRRCFGRFYYYGYYGY